MHKFAKSANTGNNMTIGIPLESWEVIPEEGDEIASEADISIPIPRVHNLLSPLLTVIPTQLIAYHTALALDCNVDRPRNLAKSVTVE